MSETFQLFDRLDEATEAALVSSIKRHGVLVPVFVDQHDRILDGHQRYLRYAARKWAREHPSSIVRGGASGDNPTRGVLMPLPDLARLVYELQGVLMRDLAQLVRDTKPFAPAVIEKRPPRGDAYVSWTHYAQRLLFTHGGYSWRPTQIIAGGEGFAVLGELTLGDEVYGAVGEDKTPTAAESNAFKRACAKAGIGLHLYEHYWLHGELERRLAEEEAGF